MGRGSASVDANLKMFFLKIEGTKKGEKVVISQTEVVGEKQYNKLTDTINEVTGKFGGAKVREFEYEGEKKHEIKILLTAPLDGEAYLLTVGMNAIGRSLINTLLNLPDAKNIGDLKVRVYNDKTSGYSKIYVEHNGVKAGWKYAPEQLNPMVTVNKVKKQGKFVEERDYFELNAFLLGEFSKKFASDVPAELGESKVAEPENTVSVDPKTGMPF